MKKLLLAFVSGLFLATGFYFSLQHRPAGFIGAVPSNGDLIGIYNATTTDLVIGDGFGSALSVDANGRVIVGQ